ncbi:MAG: ATP-binding cassette domain-containing protein, partial [Pseudomonadota bacterium]|nr:ATP-binding cassette domain-containing protein [Pseudomonadota bacterium]
MGNSLAIEARGLFKAFDGKEAVRGIDLAVPEGSIYGILGPNGAGKTTTLRMLLGIIEPDRGARSLLGRERPLEAAGIVGYLPEERGLYPAMHCREAIAFMGALRGLPLDVGRRRADQLLADNGLGDYAAKPIRSLSKGMAQTVQLFGTIVHRPRLVVLDEPFSGLDQRLREAVRQETLAVLRETRATSMLVTHDPVEAMSMADRILLMRGGRLVQQGRPETLYHQPIDADAARFFCDFNELTAPVFDGVAATPLGTFPVSGLRAGEEALIMIRPQGVQPAPGRA